jgi:hypothetical protein
MYRMTNLMRLALVLLLPVLAHGQDFSGQSSAVPQCIVSFRLSTPVVHLSMAKYAPSVSTVMAGAVTFRFYTQPQSNIFLRVRWDLDASDGVAYSDWYDDLDHPAVVTAAYAATGRKTVTVQLQMYNVLGQMQEDTKQVDIFVVPVPAGAYADTRGNELMYWPGADGVFDRPVLVVEGFDPENNESPLDKYAVGFALAESARTAGYDLLFLNFADGGASIAANKDVFLGACTFAHDKLQGRNASVQVVALSMGGIVARYGLAYAEDRTSNGMRTDHFVNTFISFDAPQQGAHINFFLQNFLRDRGSPKQQRILSSTAARELLFNNAYGSLHDQIYAQVNALTDVYGSPRGGYPSLCRSYGISNGTLRPVYTDKVAGVDLLAKLTIYKSVTVAFFDLDGLVADEVVDIPSVAADFAPGSTFTNDMTTLSTMASRYGSPVGFPFNLLLSGYGDAFFRVYFNPSYEPTEAALDLRNYYRTSDSAIVGGVSGFHETLLQTVTHRHDELTDDSQRAILAWLNANRTYAYLSAPQDVRASVGAGNAIELAFTDLSANSDSIRVERKIDGGSFAMVGSAPPRSSSYVDRDPSLQPFTRYVYRLRSVSGGRSSLVSDEAAVLYQPHLLSSLASPLGTGTQRRALQTSAPTNNRFLAYESGAWSFLVQFINDDVASGTWDREIPIGGVPPAGTEVHSPSLFPDSTGTSARVIFDEVNAPAGVHTIRHAVVDAPTNRLSVYPGPLATVAASPSFQTAPVAVMTDGAPTKAPALLAAAWRTPMNDGLSLGLGGIDAQGVFGFSSIDLNGGMLSAPVVSASNPSLAALLHSAVKPAVHHVFLAWEEANHGGVYGGIRLLHGRYTAGAQPWPPAAGQIIWESTQPVVVALNTSTESHRRPALAIDTLGNLAIAWESLTATSGSIMVQKRSWYTTSLVTAGTLTLATGSGPSTPRSVSLTDKRAVPSGGGDLVAAWSVDGGAAYAAWFNAAGGTWCTPRLIASGASQAGLAATKSAAADNRLVVSASAAGPPYAITTSTIPLTPPPPAAPALSWQTVLVNGVKRPKLTWTAVGPDVQSYAVVMYSCDPSAGDCGDGAYHSVLATTTALTYTDINTTVFTKSGTNLAPDLTNYYYVRATDRFGQLGAPSGRVAVNTQESYVLKGGAPVTDAPREYALAGNFPNPFNPTTTFRYELPAPGEVRLSIYNMLGEEVARIVDELHEAGRYEAVWDAGGAPSGVYVATMRVTGPGGTLAFSAARKVMLVR